jgi:hypothetical protein
MVSDCLAGEFGAPVREMEIPGRGFRVRRGARQYGSIAVLEMLVRLCPAMRGSCWR